MGTYVNTLAEYIENIQQKKSPQVMLLLMQVTWWKHWEGLQRYPYWQIFHDGRVIDTLHS